MTGLDRVCRALVEGGATGALAFFAGPDGELEAGAGRYEPESARALRVGDRFRAGSVTKTAVAALVLQLVEDGQVRLDDHVDRWASAHPEVTVRDLLQHTSGLADYAVNPVFRERFLHDPDWAWRPEELLELAGPSGAGVGSFAYSNTNYVVLGLVIEAVGGAPLDRLLAEHVFEPLSLRATELAASGGAAAGGLVSSAADVGHFLRRLLSGELLAPASLEEMLTTVPGDGIEFARYGLGISELDSFLGIVPSPCGTAWGHLGFLPGCTCAALSTRDGGRQAVLMAAGDVDEAFGERMWDLFCG